MKKTYYHKKMPKRFIGWILPSAFLLICVSLTAVFVYINAHRLTPKETFFQKKNSPVNQEIICTVVENKTAYVTDDVVRVNPQNTENPEATTPPKPKKVYLDVENILQKPALPNGCEVVSLAILLKYAGYTVDPVKLYDSFMPKSPYLQGDPKTTYVGNAKDIGLGCNAPCVVTTGNSYLASIGSVKKVINVSGGNMNYYERLLERGIPIMIWGTVDMNCNGRICWEDITDGQPVSWLAYSHCLVLIGYTEDTYVFCDPLRGKIHYAKTDVEASFLLNRRQACIIK